MYRVTFVSSLFSPSGVDRETSHETLQILLDALVSVNVAQMRSRVFPRLYQAGVRYRAEPRGQENWLDAIQVLTVKFADCEDLASYRAAELRVRDGVQARAVFKFWQNPATLEQRYHCLVHYTPPMGGFVIPPYARRIAPTVYEEDPSKLLGMRGAS